MSLDCVSVSPLEDKDTTAPKLRLRWSSQAKRKQAAETSFNCPCELSAAGMSYGAADAADPIP